MIDSFAPIDPKLVDVAVPEDGYPADLAAGDTPDVVWDMCGDASRKFPDHLWIDPKDWEDKARENDRLKTWPAHHCDRFTNQNPNHFCTCHSLGTAFEIVRNRQRGVIYPEGPKKDFRYPESAQFDSVWVSPMSIYSEANPREHGGASIRNVLSICIRRGFLPDRIQPKDYGFRHVMDGTTGKGGINQSRGPWVPLSKFPAGWTETAKHFRIQEVIFPETVEQIACLILHGYPVCVGRDGHAIPYALLNVRERLFGQIDSYDVIRWDSWRTAERSARGAPYAIVSVSAPDDWSRPAG